MPDPTQPTTTPDPITQTIPDQPAPTPPALNLSQGLSGPAPASQPAPQQPSVFSKLFNKISSGTDTNYTIDPNSGKTVAVQTPQKPGTLFRNILAAGLLGGGGIGPQEGEHSFAQGLLAGVSGGAKTFDARQQQQDAQRREQAQQQYANQLKAKQENREEAESTARLTLNRVQIANENLHQAALNQAAHERLDPSEVSVAQSLLEANKNTVNDLNAAGVKTYKEGLTGDELHAMITPGSPTYDPGAVSKYHGVPTGTKVVKGADGNNHEVPTYSLYDLGSTGTMQVPDTLLSRLKSAGEDKAGPGGKPSALYSELQNAYKNKTPVDYRHIVAAQKEAGDTLNMNDIVQKQLKEKYEAARAQSETYRNNLDAQLDKIKIAGAKIDEKDKEDIHNGQDLFVNGYTIAGKPKGSTDTMVVANPKGLVEAGNLNIWNRPTVKNSDGSHSTEYSTSFNVDGKEVLVPTVVNGKFLTPDGKKPPEGSASEKQMFDKALQHYRQTGQNLGKFDNPDDADAYANVLHNRGEAGATQRKIEPNAQGQYDFSDMSSDQKRAAIAYTNSQIGYAQTQVDDAVKQLDENKDNKAAKAEYDKFHGALLGFNSIKNALVPGTPYAASSFGNPGTTPQQKLLLQSTQGLSQPATENFNKTVTAFPNPGDLSRAVEFVSNAPISPTFTEEDKQQMLDKLPQYYNQVGPLNEAQRIAAKATEQQALALQQKIREGNARKINPNLSEQEIQELSTAPQPILR